MQIHRFYLPPAQCRGDALALEGAEAHHALDVLRIRQGDEVTVLDGAGQRLRCQIEDAGRGRITLRVQERAAIPPPPHRITLLQALPKGKLIESIVQKATELAAARVIPLLSERVVVQLTAAEAARKAEKWRAVCVEALKQCGCPWLPEIEIPLTPVQFLNRREDFELALVGSLQPGAQHPRLCFEEFERKRGHRPGSVALWVGPEGDFTPAELQAIQAAGAKPVTLGPNVLRTETAAIYCLSVANYELQAP